MSEASCKASSTLPGCDSHGHQHNHQEHSHDFHNHHDDHGHAGHQHFFDLKQISLKLKVSCAVTILFVIAGVVAGFYANSLALISDAAHNFTDALALILALFAVWLQGRPASATKTYGYHRAGILAAFINSSSLLLIAVGIFYEAIERIITPRPVEAGLMFWVAIAGLVVNIGIGWALHRESKTDITIRSAYVHMLGDAAGTVGIIIGSLIIKYTNSWVLDPLISVAIGLLILWTCWDILKETVNLLLEGTPKGIDVDAVSDAIQAIPGVRAAHHIHIWGIASRMTALSCHLQVDDTNLSHCQKIVFDVNCMLKERFRIDHATLQLETQCFEDKVTICQPRLHERYQPTNNYGKAS
ncbi:MAG: cation diffusion facilitator family transporter [Acidobacteriota bacterium]